MPRAYFSLSTQLLLWGGSLAIVANFLVATILGEVNSGRPTEHKVSLLACYIRLFQIWREHARLYPASRRRLQCLLCLMAGLACCLAALGVSVLSG